MTSAQEQSKPKRRRATTPEARENQMMALAMDLAEDQMRAGTASAQVITHFLKAATAREHLERKKIEQETKLLEAKIGSLQSVGRMEELVQNALKAMRAYTGNSGNDDPKN